MKRSRTACQTLAIAVTIVFAGCGTKDVTHEHYYDGRKVEVLSTAGEGSVVMVSKVTTELTNEYDWSGVTRYTHKTYVPIRIKGTQEDLRTNQRVARQVDQIIVDTAEHFDLKGITWEPVYENHESTNHIWAAWVQHDPAPPANDPEPGRRIQIDMKEESQVALDN